MSYVPGAPIASPGDSHGSGEPFPGRERQPRHRKSENPDNSDRNFPRSVFAGHRNIFLCPKAFPGWMTRGCNSRTASRSAVPELSTQTSLRRFVPPARAQLAYRSFDASSMVRQARNLSISVWAFALVAKIAPRITAPNHALRLLMLSLALL
jgi:hypothetical protein